MMVDEAHITTFAVLPEWRRHGIGARLMLEMMRLAASVNARVVTLEVRLSNVRRGRCTASSASSRWASGRATTRTTTRTR